MGYLSFFLSLLLFWSYLVGEEPLALYLSWTEEPTTSMVIQWHTRGQAPSRVVYQLEGGEGWQEAEGESHLFTGSRRHIHYAVLQGLKPGSGYRFRLEEKGQEYRFKTMPENDERPVRFVVGGDAYFYLHLFRKMNAQVAACDPDFIVLGGDIAYTHNHRALFKGADWEERRWQTFFSEWQKTMVDSEGRLIPLLVVIGNHDIRSMSEKSSEKGPCHFFELFAMPKPDKAYRALDFGDYLSLILLDSGHASPIGGEQTSWLKTALAERSQQRQRLAFYHVAAYPSVYNPERPGPLALRKQWVPLFEEYGVDTAFEHHNHAYKRTCRIRGGVADPSGVLYLGDGSWGVTPRKPKPGRWYIARAEKINSFWLVTLEKGTCHFEARDIEGRLVESFTRPYRASSKAPLPQRMMPVSREEAASLKRSQVELQMSSRYLLWKPGQLSTSFSRIVFARSTNCGSTS